MTVREHGALVVCGALVLAISGPLAVASLPAADHLSPRLKRVANGVRDVLPEGWSFFTKSPRDPFVIALTPTGDEISSAPNAQAKWAFGWDRTSRLGGIDVERVVSATDDGAWVRCAPAASRPDCERRAARSTVHLAGLAEEFCRRLVLARVAPTPWAFRGRPSPVTEVALVDVRCDA
jgi:antimicrobial peptide system SdpA family protein